jgi:hypothetical protein
VVILQTYSKTPVRLFLSVVRVVHQSRAGGRVHTPSRHLPDLNVGGGAGFGFCRLAGFRNMYGGLCSQLAADCGAVVAAVEHTDGSACAASMRDGSWCTYVHTDGALAWRQKQLQQRTAEVGAMQRDRVG